MAVEEYTTYGTTGQRYEAAIALQRTSTEFESARYLLDSDTGELVLRVSDLATAARRQLGSLPRGWLDARMRDIGWQRVELRGFGLPGRQGRRQGPHARVNVYRGHLPLDEDDEPSDTPEAESVNT